jgi:hypothetical protein
LPITWNAPLPEAFAPRPLRWLWLALAYMSLGLAVLGMSCGAVRIWSRPEPLKS